MSIAIEKLGNIIEAALLAFGQPLSVDRLMSLFSEDEQVSRQDIREALQQLQQSCEGQGIELVEVGSGYRYQARKDYAQWVSKLWEEKPPRYSRALLETLVLVAYRQPITRAEIEDIRGVSVSSHIMKTLQERDWVRVVGHKDVPGKPALYATTKAFLDYFNLKSLDELPSLMEIRDLDKISAEIDRQGQEIGLEEVRAITDAQQLLDSEDEERLLPDGDVDSGDGIEDSMDISAASAIEETTEEPRMEAEILETEISEIGIPETESREETMATAVASAETVESLETEEMEEVTTSEQPHDGQQQDNYLVIDENTSESVDEFDTTSFAEGFEAQTSEAEETANVEFASDYESDTADTVEFLEEAYEAVSVTSDDGSDREQSPVIEDTDSSAAMHSNDDETVSDEQASNQAKDVEQEYADTAETQIEDETDIAQEPRFSTASYGLRVSARDSAEHVERERDQSEYAEEEDHHSDRLSAAEPNT